jgi:alkylhydroperoxidase family enzyme
MSRSVEQGLAPPPRIVADLAPEAAEAFAAVLDLVPTVTDPVLAELARLRMSQLIGDADGAARRSSLASDLGLDEEKVGDLASWPVSERYSDLERACLALAEQYVLDVSGVSEAQTAAVLAHLGPAGLYGFVQVLYAIDESIRLDLAVRTAFALSAPSPEERP